MQRCKQGLPCLLAEGGGCPFLEGKWLRPSTWASFPGRLKECTFPWLEAALPECGQLGDGAFAFHAQHVSHQSLQGNPSKPALCVRKRKHI